MSSRDDQCQPHLLPDDEVRDISGEELDAWKLEAKSVAVSRCRLVLEDGPGLSDSDEEANVPDGEQSMYAPGSSIKTVRLTQFEAFLLRHGHAGGTDESGRKSVGHRSRGAVQ
jgi:hypothetical protein